MNATQKSTKNPGKVVKGDSKNYYLTDGRDLTWIIQREGKFWVGEMGKTKYKGNKTRKYLVDSILEIYPIY